MQQTTQLLKAAIEAEALDFAINQEVKAKENYTALLERLRDPDDIEFCQQLVTEEEAHAQRLRKLRLSLDMDHAERPGM